MKVAPLKHFLRPMLAFLDVTLPWILNMDEESDRDPVQIHILQGVGYIWNADDALYLRKTYGLIGAMVGGVAAFKQQNAVHGLPLQLYPEEVTMAVEEGWAVLCGPVLGDPTTATAGNDSRNKKRKATSGRYHYTIDEDDDADDEDFDDDGYYYQHHGEDNDEEEAEKKKNSAPWQNALAKGTPFEIPTTAEEALVAQGGRSDADNKNAASNTTTTTTNCEKIVKRADVHWTFPSTKEQRDRYLIFKDLHSRGFRITGGSKFGSDYLLYPGDPTLYHAQFCVRLVQFKESILPALMASACRGSFQARKHLLYASAVMKNEQGEILVEDAWNNDDDDDDDVFKMLRKIRGKYETQYMTFGPVDGFGKD